MGFATGLSAGSQAGANMVNTYNMVKDRRQQQQLGGLSQQYLGAQDPQQRQAVLGEIARVNPQMAFQMQAQAQNQQAQIQQAQQQKKLEMGGRMAETVLSADPKQRNQVYKAMKTYASKQGMDTSGFGEDYTPDTEIQLKSLMGFAGIKQEGQEEYKAQSPLGKIEQDYEKGVISEEAYKRQNAPEQKDLFDKTQKLRKEYIASAGDFVKVRDSFARINAATQDPTAAGDLALIFNYMKMLDPGSTVREGEFATAENSASVPTRMRAKYNKVMSGERLDPVQRTDFVGQSKKLYKSQADINERTRKQYGTLAKRAGLSEEDVALSLALPEEAKQQAKPQISREQAIAEAKRRGLI